MDPRWHEKFGESQTFKRYTDCWPPIDGANDGILSQDALAFVYDSNFKIKRARFIFFHTAHMSDKKRPSLSGLLPPSPKKKSKQHLKVSIIGTAGRDKKNPLPKHMFGWMVDRALEEIKDLGVSTNGIHLVSGGAAWADHVAVELFLTSDLEFPQLTLHMPCEWNHQWHEFLDNGGKTWKTNPAKTCNYYHKQFKRITGKKSLSELEKVRCMKGVTFDHSEFGLMPRNNRVAQSDIIIAFTRCSSGEPLKGSGTKKTWDLAPSTTKKIHVDISRCPTPTAPTFYPPQRQS